MPVLFTLCSQDLACRDSINTVNEELSECVRGRESEWCGPLPREDGRARREAASSVQEGCACLGQGGCGLRRSQIQLGKEALHQPKREGPAEEAECGP